MQITLTNSENVTNPITNKVLVATKIKIIGGLFSYTSRILRIDFGYYTNDDIKVKTESIIIKGNYFDNFTLSKQNLYQAILDNGINGTIEGT